MKTGVSAKMILLVWTLTLTLVWHMPHPAFAQPNTVDVPFEPLEEITPENALEVTSIRDVEGNLMMIAIEPVEAGGDGVAADNGGTQLVQYEKVLGVWVRTVIAIGQFFSLSKLIAYVGGVYFFTVVNNFDVFRYELNLITGLWILHQITSSGDVASATLALTGLLLTVAFFNNTIRYYEWNTLAVAFVLLPWVITAVGVGFNGFKIPVSAADPQGNIATVFQDLAGILKIATIIAGVLAITTVASLGIPLGFNEFIETAAVFLAGFFFFMFLTQSGDVRMARINPATLVVTLITLGTLTLPPGAFPALALLAAGGFLFAFWGGAAKMIHPATLQVFTLLVFPLVFIGVMVASIIGNLMYVAGKSASASFTTFDPDVAIAGAITDAIPSISEWGFLLLAFLLLVVSLYRVRKRLHRLKA